MLEWVSKVIEIISLEGKKRLTLISYLFFGYAIYFLYTDNAKKDAVIAKKDEECANILNEQRKSCNESINRQRAYDQEQYELHEKAREVKRDSIVSYFEKKINSQAIKQSRINEKLNKIKEEILD